MYYNDRNEKAIKTLHPIVQNKVRQLIEQCEEIGEDFLIYSAGRTEGEQNELYERGRTKKGRIVTGVKGKDSYHVWGCAIDLVPVTLLALQWNAYDRYHKINTIAVRLGFTWGLTEWGIEFGDYGHFHYSQGLSIEDLKSGKKLQEEEEPIKIYPKYAHIRAVERAMKRFSGRTLGRVLLRLQKRFIT